jgi:hypothetical protein
MDLSALHNLAEERVTTALGIPAAVVGFGSGLEEAHTNATYRELREQAWEAKLIPDGRLLGGDVREQLLPEFVSGAALDRTEFGFDLSKVRALQDDENKKAERWKNLVTSRIALVAEARSAFDLDVEDSDKIFLEPINLAPVPRKLGELLPGETAPAPPPALPPGGPPQPALPAGAAAASEEAAKLRAVLVELRSAVTDLAHARPGANGHGATPPELAEDARKALLEQLSRPGLSREDLIAAVGESTARATEALVKARETDRAVISTLVARVESGQRAAAEELARAIKAIESRPPPTVTLPAPRKVRLVYDAAGDKVVGAEPVED